MMVTYFRASAGAAALAAASLLGTGATPALAQQAGIEIIVVDAAGNPVTDAEVEIANPAIGLARSVRTDARGSARVDGLTTAGEYLVSVPGTERYAALAARPVELRANFARSVILQLAASGDAGIVVTAARAITGLKTANAEISASLARDQLVALPVEGRDAIGALIRLPNVVPSTGFFPEAPSISINGSNGLDTNYLIDGLDNNENFLGGIKFPVPLGFTREVTILANSYSAAYGRTANGIVNYTTPSGSNEFTGEVYFLLRPGRPLDSRSPFPRRDLSGNPVGESFERYQAGFAIDRPGGGLGGGNATFPSAGSRQDRFSTLVAATASYAGNEWSYDGAVQFSRFRWDYGEAIGAPGPQVVLRDPSGLVAGVVGNPGFVFDNVEETWQTTHRLQRDLGAHTLRVGADIILSDFALLGGGNPEGNFTVDLTAAQLASRSGPGRSKRAPMSSTC